MADLALIVGGAAGLYFIADFAAHAVSWAIRR